MNKISDWKEELQKTAKICDSVINMQRTSGWRELKVFLDKQIEVYQEKLEREKDYENILDLQSNIKAVKSIYEFFLEIERTSTQIKEQIYQES